MLIRDKDGIKKFTVNRLLNINHEHIFSHNYNTNFNEDANVNLTIRHDIKNDFSEIRSQKRHIYEILVVT